MPRYYEDKPEGGACAGVKEDLGACLLQSDCVLQVAQPDARGGETPEPERQSPAKEGKSPRQCLKEGNCQALKYSFFECKRSMLDARSRFRGRKGY
ncbi:cytochrome c oxidase assembly factor 5 isoform X1 [Suricata suricatta]|uniref:cytochrome c oxidase assembly factor 5 isoform X1 n=1 Tax=Suricata suricatta TaxID=37032 RepID=UPI001155699F|nr:cytochrome c oxidase assembly factor 5 isoform X1 [Suricata suricatta]